MTRIVISERHGGFGLGREAMDRMRAGGYEGREYDVPRDDPRLVQIVEEMGVEAGHRYAELVIVEIPDGVAWHIHEYDGYETVHEDHRSWSSDGEASGC